MIALLNGAIYNGNDFYEAVVTEGKRIVYAGDSIGAQKYITDKHRKIYLDGKLVLPGFVDSHAHGAHFMGLCIDKIDLTGGRSVEDYKEIIKTFVNENPDIEFYQGIGWASPLFSEEGPEKEILDEICSTKPMVIRSGEGHSIWANSAAIEMAGIDENTHNPDGGIIEKNSDGSIRGTFKEEAQQLIDRIVPEISVKEYKKAIARYQKLMAAYGYTATAEMMMSRNGNIHKAYRELSEEGALIMKASVHYQVNPSDGIDFVKTQMKDPEHSLRNRLSQGYYAKIFIDGVVEGSTAWLKEPYSNDRQNYGTNLWNDEELFEVCKVLDEFGYDLHFHVIGDAAAAQMIRAVEYIKTVNTGRSDRRPVAAHVQLISPKDIEKMGKLGISVSSNPYWFGIEDTYSKLVEYPLLGERANRQFPMKSLIDAGIIVSVGSDFAITEDPNPILAMRMGMLRTYEGLLEGATGVLNPGECVNLKTMVDAVTCNGAYTLRMDDETGCIEAGKLADLVVIDKNLFEMQPEDIHKTEVLMTISEGEIIYEKE